jgi:type I restriction enzyme S subunit
MSRWQPYAEYKDSDVEWLGEIPAHWETRRLKYVAPESGEKLGEKPDDATYLGLENVESNTGRLLLDNLAEEVASTVVAFRRGDILFGKLRPYLAKVVHADFDGVGTTEFLVLRAFEDVEAHFLFYCLLSDGVIEAINGLTYGSKMPRANSEQVGNLYVGLTSLPEQRAIAAFLDRETARIDALVAKQERLIALLQEKRAALISYAVTKGLDPDVEMKDSGVEWLGEIPVHWAAAPVYARYQVQLGKMLDQKQVTGEHLYPYLRNVDVQWDQINVVDLPEMDFPPSSRTRFALRPGDLLVCEGGEVGRTAIWHGELEDCYYQKALHRLRPYKRNDVPRFFFYVMCDAASRGVFTATGNPNTIDHLTAEKLRKHRFAFPPLGDQRAITAYLDREIAKLDALIAKAQEMIARLQEYRTALISAAVTGKIDVRGEV